MASMRGVKEIMPAVATFMGLCEFPRPTDRASLARSPARSLGLVPFPNFCSVFCVLASTTAAVIFHGVRNMKLLGGKPFFFSNFPLVGLCLRGRVTLTHATPPLSLLLLRLPRFSSARVAHSGEVPTTLNESWADATIKLSAAKPREGCADTIPMDPFTNGTPHTHATKPSLRSPARGSRVHALTLPPQKIMVSTFFFATLAGCGRLLRLFVAPSSRARGIVLNQAILTGTS